MTTKLRRQSAVEPTGTTRIGSVRTYLDALEKLDHFVGANLFFRGHPSFTYALTPSVYRDPMLVANEDVIFKELVLRCPSDFASLGSTFQMLVKMQHYGLPTRLLDLTANPLIALYFACDTVDPPSESGEVIAFRVPTQEVKYYDSDTVSVIANIARRPSEFKIPTFKSSNKTFNSESEIRYLLHEIKKEKPYFEPEIVREHLGSVLCVRPKLENPRIIRQDGAFFLFGVNESKQFCAALPERSPPASE